MNTTQPSDISRRKRNKAIAVPIGAVMQYARRAGQQSDVAVVRVVAESRTGWFVVERVNVDGCAVRRHVKATHLSSRSPELF